MTRFFSTLGWELRIQYRQGLYFAAAFIVVIWTAMLLSLPADATRLLLPFAIFMDGSLVGFYFMAGALYLERDEGVLEAVVITPQPRSWYLLSKVASLTLVALVATVLLVLIVLIVWRGPVNWPYLIAGTVFNGWMLTLVGFIIAARYDAINEFIVPSIVFMIPSQIPALDYFGIWQSWLIYLLPTQGPMLLIAGAFQPLEEWQVLYAFVYSTLACAVVSWLAIRTFNDFVVRKQASRR